MTNIESLFGEKRGKVESIDFDGLTSYFDNFTREQKERLHTHLYKDLGWGKDQQSEVSKMVHRAFDDTFPDGSPALNTESEDWKASTNAMFYRNHVERTLSAIKKLLEFSIEFEQPLDYYFRDDVFTAVGCGGKVRYLIPTEYVRVKPNANYEGESILSMRAKLQDDNGISLMPAGSSALTTMTIRSAKESLKSAEADINRLNGEIADIKAAATGELAKMREEIERQQAALETKKQSMLEKAQQLKGELELKKFQLETQVYMLDSEIYSIRCLLGETVDFVKLRSGQPAEEKTPMVVFQKIRFLDEELARLAAIYDVDGEFEYIERFFKHSPYTFEFFVPAPRSVSLVRISRTEVTVTNNDKPGFQNCLKAYKLEHGSCIGIMVRDGDNLWMGWTDEGRVNIKEDMFFTERTVVESLSGNEQLDVNKSELEIGQEKLEQAKPMVSRAFVFNILQGFICGNKGLIKFPEEVNFARAVTQKNTPYIVFSAADGWLEDNRYGTMNDIIEKCNSRLVEGDMILTTQRISPENYNAMSHRYLKNNDRGRGYNDRTHDCYVSDCTIYRLNLIEPVMHHCYIYIKRGENSGPMFIKGERNNPYTAPNGERYAFKYDIGGSSSMARLSQEEIDDFIKGRLKENEQVVCVDEYDEMAHYISVLKSCSLSGTARSNMRVYPGEFINLTYFNSVWCEYLLTTRKTGDFRQFANAAKYLNTALQFVRKRELEEHALIAAYYPELDKIPDWPVRLSEWKLDKGVRSITAYQAKRFAGTLAKQSGTP